MLPGADSNRESILLSNLEVEAYRCVLPSKLDTRDAKQAVPSPVELGCVHTGPLGVVLDGTVPNGHR